MSIIYNEISRILLTYDSKILYRKPLDQVQLNDMYHLIDLTIYIISRCNLLDLAISKTISPTSKTSFESFNVYLDYKLDGSCVLYPSTDYFIYLILCLISRMKHPRTYMAVFNNITLKDLNSIIIHTLGLTENKYDNFIGKYTYGPIGSRPAIRPATATRPTKQPPRPARSAPETRLTKQPPIPAIRTEGQTIQATRTIPGEISLEEKLDNLSSLLNPNNQDSNQLTNNTIALNSLYNVYIKYSANNVTIHGIKDLTNTCYLVSAIQCIIKDPFVYDYVIYNRHKPEGILKQLYNIGNNIGNDLKQVQTTIQNFNPSINVGRQNDCHEAFITILNILKNNTKIELKFGGGSTILDSAISSINTHYKGNYSIINQIYDFLICRSITCDKCKTIRKLYDIEAELNLNARNSTIEELISEYFNDEQINDYNCYICNAKHNATMSKTIFTYPIRLIITIKRAGEQDNRIDANIKYPYSLNFYGRTYSIGIIVHHIGTTTDGHYYVDVFNGNPNRYNGQHKSSIKSISNLSIFEDKTMYFLIYNLNK